MRGPIEVRGTRYERQRRKLVPRTSYLIALLPLLACADFDPNEPPPLPDSLVAEPSFARDIQPVFTARCATAGCHTAVTHQAGLVLAAGHAYDSIVGRPSSLAPSLALVEPGDPDASMLVRMISDDPERRFGHPRMPLGLEPLTERQIANIVTWVTQGALRN